ncbi:nicotinate-nucleotide adenylyltransferase [Peptoniphilus koenoeneniae]|uniref:Probable nicotinate-nucleotide adenylyltransferase n=1 Tax=Peptoniphilus koenoeneniae TaxID=507751 RepID=A0ABU0AUB4_9FIRM|nr:nicotinate-nucleotide adenylyltransferase [Peptoniphilus koenoeneniae]MDQ0274854.1 nicotinate-nucleotide adenylyltransferase [Peptoniphilus koenoeneniae]
MKYGIMGGTFNPIHLGHLMIAEYLSEQMNIDKVIFLPTGNPPHKDHLKADAFHRFNMTYLAIKDNPKFIISDIETIRTGFSYTVDTLNELKSLYRGDFYFFLGSDTVFLLKLWKNFDQVAKNCKFVASIRPGYEKIDELKNEIAYLKKNYGAEIYLLKDLPQYEISSTDIRKRIKEGKSIKYLVPDNVIKYIEDEGLYENY